MKTENFMPRLLSLGDEIKRSPPISRILSRTVIYLGCMFPCTSCGLPTTSFARRADGTGGLLGLAPGGVFRAVAVTSDAVRSYRTPFTLAFEPKLE